MLTLTERLLELSMNMAGSRHLMIRLLGKLLGIFPVWYSSRMERRLFNGTWDPVKKYRKKKGKK